jgi:hypothetical protein
MGQKTGGTAVKSAGLGPGRNRTFCWIWIGKFSHHIRFRSRLPTRDVQYILKYTADVILGEKFEKRGREKGRIKWEKKER